jgi:hypothetical protein
MQFVIVGLFTKIGTIHYVVTTTKDEFNDILKNERYYYVDIFQKFNVTNGPYKIQ